jgi:hypothetical protein
MSPRIPSPAATAGPPEVVYPDSEGKPMGETGFHVKAIFELYQALNHHLAARRTDFYADA